MEKLQLKKKRVEVMIDDDPERVISFNPYDPKLRDRIYKLGKTIHSKQAEVEKQIPEIDTLEGKDELGVSLKDVAAHNLIVELAEFISKEIDTTFGEGTSEKLYYDGFDFESTVLFMDFVTGKLQEVSKDKIDQRLSKPVKNKKVMK